MRQEEYNGWTNYETWLVKLWLDNEYSSYCDMKELPQQHKLEDMSLADAIKDYVEELVEQPASLAFDLIRSALAEVNWQEIAKAYHEEASDDAR